MNDSVLAIAVFVIGMAVDGFILYIILNSRSAGLLVQARMQFEGERNVLNKRLGVNLHNLQGEEICQ